MRTLPLFLFAAISGVTAFGQRPLLLPTAPVPADPLELVTGPTHIPATPAERGALVALVIGAEEKHAMHARGGPAHILQISFNASATTLYPGGAGQLRETWISGENWRWDGSLGDYQLLRISSDAAIYDQNPAGPIPMRLKMLANAVFAPIEGAPRRATLRSATVAWKGAQLTCVLMSGAGNQQTDAQGRQWYESEYCIDPATGLLNIASIAPGVYTVYDYTHSLRFHGRVLPGRVTISENGTAVVDAQLTDIADTDPKDKTPFTPTAQMIAQGAATALGSPNRFPIPTFSASISGVIQPAIVHATIDAQGKVLESEVLQTSAVSATALQMVTAMNFGVQKPAGGAAPVEREAYINVRFFPQQQ